MADKFHHEAIYRGSEQLAKLADQRLTICGAAHSVPTWPTTWPARAFGNCASSIATAWRNTTSARNFMASRTWGHGRSKCCVSLSAQPALRSTRFERA